MMIMQTTNPMADALQGLIESQTLQIELLRAQIHAFQALATTIEREAPGPASIPSAQPRPWIVQNIPA